ncbi:hypothetical protein CCR95_16220 [Thiocystis minor]|uniref:hypothetical protein n=1 Tax=Thiocystis minor TaxID=61597 RepID=UPI00191239BF|nr:hypothetical protein [Thiocystis minor]MBK5965590.1 hypothetical protein [Thiocystis minor]
MLFDKDRDAFSKLLDDLGDHYGRLVSVRVKTTWWRLLETKLDLATLREALDQHLLDGTRGRFFPQPSDVLVVLERAVGGRPSADEAWALGLETFDEAATVCVTDEILLASAAAAPVWEIGDKVGARMAFKAAYERVVTERRIQGQRPRWQLSLGWDGARRALAVQAALEAGRLSDTQARAFLPAPELPGAAMRIAGKRSGQVVPLPVDEEAAQRQRWRALREAIHGHQGCAHDAERPNETLVASERERCAQRKQQVLVDLERLQASQDAS